jgi:hypothetical protein
MELALRHFALRALTRCCSARSAGDRGEMGLAGTPWVASARMARSSAETVGTVRLPAHPITASPMRTASTMNHGTFPLIYPASGAIIPHPEANRRSVFSPIR